MRSDGAWPLTVAVVCPTFPRVVEQEVFAHMFSELNSVGLTLPGGEKEKAHRLECPRRDNDDLRTVFLFSPRIIGLRHERSRPAGRSGLP